MKPSMAATIAVALLVTAVLPAAAFSSACEVDGLQIPHAGARYLSGEAQRRGSIVASCANGVATCYEERGLADAPPEINRVLVDCSEATRRRKLGVAVLLEEDVWPDGIVWYRVNGNFSDYELEVIETAVALYGEADVNVTLQECEPESLCGGKYVSIEQNEDACYGYVGYVDDGQPQLLNLGDSCFDGGPGNVVHELGHAMGLYHEHIHPDREVVVLTDQNLPVSADNYAKTSSSEAVLKPYDPQSIMHYGRSAGLCFPKAQYPLKSFCDVEQVTNCVQPVEQHCNSSRDSEIGQRAVLSAGDIYTLRALYGSKDNASVNDVPIPSLSSSTAGSVAAADAISDVMPHSTATNSSSPSSSSSTAESASSSSEGVETVLVADVDDASTNSVASETVEDTERKYTQSPEDFEVASTFMATASRAASVCRRRLRA